MSKDRSVICLFDVDGTLTPSRKKIDQEMESLLERLSTKVCIGLVGGSDIEKICEQMGGGKNVISKFDYVFAENGLVAHKNGLLHSKESILKHVGEETLQNLINYCLNYMSNLKLPAKRGNFIEFRDSLINVCPVGRSCSQIEREEFYQYDQIHKIREKFVEALRKDFYNSGLEFTIGGQISFDVFPIGWNKTYCLNLIKEDGFDKIYFFGDKTTKGGNDFEIFTDERTIGHTVNNPQDTKTIIQQIFF